MTKRIVVFVLAIALGVVAGMALMTGLHIASGWVYPMPASISAISQEPANLAAMRAWIATLPTGAFVLATLAHGLGCMGGAAVSTLTAGRRSMVAPLVVGVLFTIAGFQNLSDIPHPAWFAFVDLPLYVMLAVIAGRLLLRRPAAAI